MSALAKELPLPFPTEWHGWVCIACPTYGISNHRDDVPAICPKCASAYIRTAEIRDPDADEDDYDEEDDDA